MEIQFPGILFAEVLSYKHGFSLSLSEIELGSPVWPHDCYALLLSALGKGFGLNFSPQPSWAWSAL